MGIKRGPNLNSNENKYYNTCKVNNCKKKSTFRNVGKDILKNKFTEKGFYQVPV